jgi:hypothetical protein
MTAKQEPRTASLGQPTTIDEPYLARIGQAAGRNRMLTAFTSDIRTTDPEEGSDDRKH